jgi:hypothetical protein
LDATLSLLGLTSIFLRRCGASFFFGTLAILLCPSLRVMLHLDACFFVRAAARFFHLALRFLFRGGAPLLFPPPRFLLGRYACFLFALALRSPLGCAASFLLQPITLLLCPAQRFLLGGDAGVLLSAAARLFRLSSPLLYRCGASFFVGAAALRTHHDRHDRGRERETNSADNEDHLHD